MRRILFNRAGRAQLYATGAGVLYDLNNRPWGVVQAGQVLGLEGRHLGWFDGAFLRDEDGFVLAFMKGATPEGDLALPKPEAVRDRLEPTPLAFKPLLVPRERPEDRWAWSGRTLDELAQTWV